MHSFAPFLWGDQTTVKETYVIDDNYKNLDQQIAQFRTSMLDTRKTGTVMELNEAIWMMEASFNYYHGFTGEDYLATKTDTTVMPVAYSGFDDVPSSELSSLFKQVNNAIVASYDNYPAENKRPYIYDLELQGTANGSQLLVITTVGTVNTQKDVVIGTETPFGSTDYWYPSFLYGKCGAYTGTYAGSRDASTEWPRKLRLKYNPQAYLYHYVDLVTLNTYIEPYQYPYANPFPGHLDYMLLEGSEDCLEPAMMNFYYNGLDYVVQDHKPVGKTFADCLIQMDFIVAINETNYWKEVVESIEYGVRVLNEADNEPGLPSPL